MTTLIAYAVMPWRLWSFAGFWMYAAPQLAWAEATGR